MTPGEKLEELLNNYADEDMAHVQGRVFYWLEFACPVDVVAREFLDWAAQHLIWTYDPQLFIGPDLHTISWSEPGDPNNFDIKCPPETSAPPAI